MEFNGQYLTFEEYRTLGGTLSQVPFNILEFEARRKIDEKTQNRLINLESTEIPQAVKLCLYKLIDTISDYISNIKSAMDNGNIASESIDGYSVSYVKASQVKDIINSKTVEINDTITSYLTGVVVNGEHIIYLGVK
jgi:hypothetical protein